MSKPVYVCAACGKTASNKEDFKDVSCYIYAVLCKQESFVYENGLVIKADAIKEEQK